MVAIAGWGALIAWGCWIAFNLLLVALASFIVHPNQPCFTGLRVIIPGWVARALTTAELAAINAHEHGHKAHWHVWKNFAALCFFMPTSPETRLRQEYEADDYAAAREHGAALASALMKLSTHPNDIDRAERLLRTR